MHPEAPERATPAPREDLAPLLGALDEIRPFIDTDLILRRAIELLRDRIGLKRAGIFMLDPSRSLMLGTWGMDLACAVVDEHQIVYDLRGTDLEALRRTEEGRGHFAVFEDSPIIEHQGGETRIAGRGWVAKTPIPSAQGPIAMLFNDAALTGAPPDRAKQAQAAAFCSILGAMLDPVRGWFGRRTPGQSPSQRLVASTVGMLNKDPGLGGKEIAAALNMSLSRVARVFKTLMGISLVEYRNRLRLERFEAIVDRGPRSLLDAALEAGFGSYAQFHRVFRAQLHTTPSAYLRPVGRGSPAPGASGSKAPRDRT
ncbi:MAG TPA: helix-turn-helix domain-containing protein [Polyangia bacterium]|nr:helix-turn-helix domain-containing protein [Polyangia bacterium]HVZ89406.1 helix-turn-helix domain-containing protein [Polyangia bacterium]